MKDPLFLAWYLVVTTLFVLPGWMDGTAFAAAFLVPHQSHQGYPSISCNAKETQPTSTCLHFFNFGKPSEPEKQIPDPPPATPKQSQPQQPVKKSVEEEPDLIEKIFSVFFGKPEESPFGLKRFDEKRFPEQYPATTTDFDVEPVATDNAEMALLRPLLKNTNLETRGLSLTYDAGKNGWDPIRFHTVVDRKGPALVVCETQSGLLCGGYNPKGWVGYGEARGSIAAFLFRRTELGSSKSKSSDSSSSANEWIKLKKVGGPSLAQGA